MGRAYWNAAAAARAAFMVLDGPHRFLDGSHWTFGFAKAATYAQFQGKEAFFLNRYRKDAVRAPINTVTAPYACIFIDMSGKGVLGNPVLCRISLHGFRHLTVATATQALITLLWDASGP